MFKSGANKMKPRVRKHVTLTVVALLTLLPAFSMTPLWAQDGPVSYWPFDDGLNPTADVAGGNDGVLIGDTKFVVQDLGGADIAPIIGNVDALDFIGDGGDFVEVPDNPTLDLAGSFTIAAWVNVDDVREHTVVSKESTDIAPLQTNYNLHVLNSRVILAVTFDAAASPNPSTSGTPFCDPGGCGLFGTSIIGTGSWHHLAAVYDNSSKSITVYLDGLKDGQGSFNTLGSPLTNGTTLQIGARKATEFGGPGTNGKIDDVRIYDRALSDAEVAALASPDGDGDGIADADDNCPDDANANQADAERDGVGDVCDSDDDNDTVGDADDNCPLDPNMNQADADGDGFGNICDSDDDNDGVIDGADLCVPTASGQVVNGDGCAIADLCPCANDWKNHGAYVSCVSKAADEFLALGLITGTEKNAITSAAGQSSCGSKK